MPIDTNQFPAGEAAVPEVTVIIPTFNRATLVCEAITSVLRQTFGDFELIVIDDGSTDKTAEMVKAFTDRRLIFIRQENQGRSAARNRAISLARGRYIAFLDSDDTYLEDKLARQVSFMNAHADVDMIYTSALCIDEQGNLLDRQIYNAWAEGRIYEKIAFFQPVTITLPTVMLRRDVLDAVGGFDEKMDRFEDTDLWRRIAKAHRIGILKQPTCILRTHGDNALQSQDPSKIAGAIEYYVAKIFREDADVGVAFLRVGASRLYEYYGRAFMSVPGWRRLGVSLLGKSIAFAPRRMGAVGVAGMKTLIGSMARQFVTKVT